MPQRVPTTQLYSFAAPAVKGGDLVVPVCLGSGQIHGLRASVDLWRRAAEGIVAATNPAALKRARLSASRSPDERFADDHDAALPTRSREVTVDRAPLAKPGGQLL